MSRKTSLANTNLGLLDTGEAYLSTNPGTLIEINGAPWGTITNSPATLNVCVGQVVPVGNVIQGLPEV
jgi:gamma-glutamylcysteine synthetase